MSGDKRDAWKGKKKWNKSKEWKIIALDDNRSREIDPYLPIESFLRSKIRRECRRSASGRVLTISRRIVSLEDYQRRVRRGRDRPLTYSDFSRWSYTLASLDRPPQPGNPRSRVHLIIIAKGAGGAARCPLNRSSTTSAPPPRNYESLRAGFHRGNTPGTHRVLHAKE